MGRKAGGKNRKVLALTTTSKGSRTRIIESRDDTGVQTQTIQIFDSDTSVWENIILDTVTPDTESKLKSENLLNLRNSKKRKSTSVSNITVKRTKH